MTAAPVEPPFGDLWKVARLAEVNALPCERRDEVLAWMRGLGLEPATLRPVLVVSQDAVTGRHLLHLSRFVYDRDGTQVIDHAEERLHTEPLVLQISDWPSWLVDVSHAMNGAG